MIRQDPIQAGWGLFTGTGPDCRAVGAGGGDNFTAYHCGLKQRDCFKGVLYAGLITAAGPKVLDYNVRFGDPECQVVLPRLQSDLASVMLAVVNGNLAAQQPVWRQNHTACVVMASGGYPGPYEKGQVITGLSAVRQHTDVYVFHAGTTKQGQQLLTNGGRVLAVTAWGDTLQEALDKAYRAVKAIHFAGAHYRRDIGHKATAHTEKAKG